jgi:glutamate synthase domain-containing protein 2
LDKADVIAFEELHPQPFNRDQYLGAYADTHPESTEPYTNYIKHLAQHGLKKHGHHGPSAAMGVDRNTLPKWEDIQFLPAQLSRRPLLDHEAVTTQVVIGPNAKKPLVLDIPIFVSDMSFGALSREAKISLSKGANMAGTGICSGEGGMLPEEQSSNDRYFYELASAQFGFSWDKLKKVQAFHFKGGQGAKTGTGGHLPGAKVTEEIAAVRGLEVGQDAISPATFPDFHGVKDFQDFAAKVREVTGGIPIGFKIAASRIEEDIDFALEAGADYIILDGRGGGTGAAPTILRDNINVPTIPAVARARKHLDKVGARNITLVATGGLRVPEDFAKAMMLGADAIAVSNSALQAIGCIGMRACNSNNCPVGIATMKESLRARIEIDKSAQQLCNFLTATNDLIKVVARACGHSDVNQFNHSDLSTFSYDMHRLTGIKYAGMM